MTTQTPYPLPEASAPGALARALRSRWAALPVLLTGTFMIVLDFFIVNVALGSMRTGLHASASAIEWVVAGYALTSAVLLVAAARAADRFGRRRVFTAGLGLFTVASAACGLAPDPTALVIARLVQGGGAAIVMPTVLALIGVIYTGADRARALSAYGMVMGVAAAGGQLIGGALVTADVAGLGWRSVFLINLPIGAVALAAVRVTVPESRAQAPGRVDAAGIALITAALTAIVLPLVEGRQHGWPLWTWLSLACAPLLIGVLTIQQRRLAARDGSPIVPPELFRREGFTPALLAQLLFWCGQASFFLILALYLQVGRGLSAMDAGLVFTTLAAAYLAASMRAPELTVRHGRRVLAAGAGLLVCGHVALLETIGSIGVHGAVLALTPGLLLVGAGMGLGITPLATLLLAGLDPEQAGATSGVLATIQNVGNALGVAVIGVVFFGQLGHGFGHAYAVSSVVLAGLLAAVALLTRLIPAPVGS